MQISQINDVNVQTNYTSKLNKFVPCMNSNTTQCQGAK